MLTIVYAIKKVAIHIAVQDDQYMANIYTWITFERDSPMGLSIIKFSPVLPFVKLTQAGV